MSISTNYLRLRESIPDDVIIVLSVKTRTIEEIEEAIDAGATHNDHGASLWES